MSSVRPSLVAAWACMILGAWEARAEPPPSSAQERAAAETLFREARELAIAGKIAEACAGFAESQRLDPHVGTLVYLATCHEQQGKTATAWVEFTEAEAQARRAGLKERIALAHEKAEQLGRDRGMGWRPGARARLDDQTMDDEERERGAGDAGCQRDLRALPLPPPVQRVHPRQPDGSGRLLLQTHGGLRPLTILGAGSARRSKRVSCSPMAGDDDDLRLNTLNRFAKRSPRLTLEEYSSCEVPAGCGGVVLRWVNLDKGRQVLVSCALGGDKPAALAQIDGGPLESARAMLAYGPHMLGLDIAAGSAPRGLFVVVRLVAPPARGQRPLAASSPGRRWEVAAREPGVGWCSPDAGADAAFARARAAPPAALEPLVDWRVQSFEREGATALLLPPGRCWVRHRFEVQR
jgi:hypothetical protein